MPNLIPYRVLYRTDLPCSSFAVPAAVSAKNYTEIGTVEATDLEALFRDMNAVDGTETCCKLRVRSMTIGDVAIDTRDGEGVVYYCASVGWKPVAWLP